MQAALDALNTLKEGNARFVAHAQELGAGGSDAGKLESGTQASVALQAESINQVGPQYPIAIILGCSDSRVPVELVFDQGFGKLFVIRVAGNVAAPPQLGSIEFAVHSFQTPLIVVLGHSNCGAVAATINELANPQGMPTPNLWSIADRISPAVSTLLETPLKDDKEALIAHGIRANVRLAADHLRHGSQTLEEQLSDNKLLVVGAEYSLETGVVEFFDGVPEQS